MRGEHSLAAWKVADALGNDVRRRRWLERWLRDADFARADIPESVEVECERRRGMYVSALRIHVRAGDVERLQRIWIYHLVPDDIMNTCRDDVMFKFLSDEGFAPTDKTAYHAILDNRRDMVRRCTFDIDALGVLGMAIVRGDASVVRYCVELGADVSQVKALNLAIRSPDVFSFLANECDAEADETTLHALGVDCFRHGVGDRDSMFEILYARGFPIAVYGHFLRALRDRTRDPRLRVNLEIFLGPSTSRY